MPVSKESFCVNPRLITMPAQYPDLGVTFALKVPMLPSTGPVLKYWLEKIGFIWKPTVTTPCCAQRDRPDKTKSKKNLKNILIKRCVYILYFSKTK